VRVCNDRRLRACWHIFHDERDIKRTLAAVSAIASDGIPPGTPTESEWKGYMLDGED
jgi:hypothetical protein